MTETSRCNVYSCGWNEDYRTAQPTDNGSTLLPLAVQQLRGTNVYKVGVGYRHSLFVSNKGKIYTCGEGLHGALGHGDRRNREEPEPIVTFSRAPHPVFVAVRCGMHSSFAVTGQGALWSWGRGW